MGEAVAVADVTLPHRRQSPRAWRFPVALFLLGLGVLGAVREHHASALVAPLLLDLPPLDTVRGIREMNVRVAGRFAEAGAFDRAVESNWAMHTAAHYLLEGGSCGPASLAMGAMLTAAGRPFHIVLANVTETGASHVMVEVAMPDGRWILVDPLVGIMFTDPSGTQLTVAEIRALPEEQRFWLGPQYQPGGEWSLFARNERTNWERVGPLAPMARAVLPQDFSMGAFMIVLSSKLAPVCALLLALFLAVTAPAGWWSRRLRR